MLVRWALDGRAGTVLDPSYGGCAMLRVALDELDTLGARRPTEMVFGADIDSGTAQWAAHLVSQGVPAGHLQAADFLSLTPGRELPLVAAVAGNPPYVRHHRLTSAARRQAVAAAATAGVTLSGRASLWAYFVVHAARFVRPGGRMALLLPGAVLQADYSPDVLAYLERSFQDVLLVRVRERIFVDAQEETVALLASGAGRAGGADRSRFAEVDDLDGLAKLLAATPATAPPAADAQLDGIAGWKTARVPPTCLELLTRLLAAEQVRPLGAVATVRLGTVTGANSVFVLSNSEAHRLGVHAHTLPVVSRSAWLQGPVLTTKSLDGARGTKAGRLLTLPADFALDRRTRLGRHLAAAEDAGVDERRHCRREPWWALGDVPVPHAFLPYTVASPLGITVNEAEAASTNTVHQVCWRQTPTATQERSWILSTWSALGRVCTELYGRHYGGGVLKLELSAANRLPVVDHLTVPEPAWAAARHDRALAQQLADAALLDAGLELAPRDLDLLRAVAASLAGERVGRRHQPTTTPAGTALHAAAPASRPPRESQKWLRPRRRSM